MPRCLRSTDRSTFGDSQQPFRCSEVRIFLVLRTTWPLATSDLREVAVARTNSRSRTVRCARLGVVPVRARRSWRRCARSTRSTRDGAAMTRANRHELGFTLIEILVVIVVIAVLAGMVAPNVFKHVGEAKSVSAHSQIEMLGAALDSYRLDNGRYPSTGQGLAALWT